MTLGKNVVIARRGLNILVPIILYIDGIFLNAHVRLILNPLNMTLGVINVETRKQPEAWETLYFHPGNEFLII